MPGALFPRSPTSEIGDLPNIERRVRPKLEGMESGFTDHDIVVVSSNSSASLTFYENSKSSSSPYVGKPETQARRTKTQDRVNSLGSEGEESQWMRSNGNEGRAENSNAGMERQQQEWTLERMEERLRDKEMIQRLEEEIRKLKEELLKKDDNLPSILLPPPPPPPPVRADDKRIHPALGNSDSSLLIASARAALRRAPMPIEAPINPLKSTKRQGLPTIGVPPDKMAAFLSELKNVRLRKVRSVSGQVSSAANLSINSNTSSASDSSFGGLSDRMDSNSASSVNSTFEYIDSELVKSGTKRKRELSDRHRQSLSYKRPLEILAIHPHTNIEKRSPPKMCTTTSSLASRIGADPGTCLSVYTDAATPSLASDNDHDVSPDEHVPQTPPRVHPQHPRHIGGVPEIIDVDAYIDQNVGMVEDLASPLSPQTVPIQSSSTGSIFSRRLPTSPLPNDLRRKPHRPSKLPRPPRSVISVTRDGDDPPPPTNSAGAKSSTNRYLIHKSEPSRQHRGESTESNSRPLTQRSKGPCQHHSRRRSGQTNPPSAHAHLESPRTLDEELRCAVKSLESIGAGVDNEECGTLFGIGIRENLL
ncbi:hypothetical protein AX15_001461 [Amanita polypyramis BW_CC]|nr:hypothetical protein AX15_001461 [Amanita polypyramis BW_CC]